MTHLARSRVILTSFCAMVLAAGAARAQNARGLRIVTLLQVESLPGGTSVTLVHRGRLQPGDVVVVTPRTTVEELGAALTVLRRVQNEYGDTLRQDMRVQITSFRSSGSWNGPGRALAQAWMQSLRRSDVRTVEGVGRGRTLEIKIGGRRIDP